MLSFQLIKEKRSVRFFEILKVSKTDEVKKLVKLCDNSKACVSHETLRCHNNSPPSNLALEFLFAATWGKLVW